MWTVSALGDTVSAWGPTPSSQSLGTKVLAGKRHAAVITATPGFYSGSIYTVPFCLITPDVDITCNEANWDELPRTLL